MAMDLWSLIRGMARAPAYSGRDLGLKGLVFAIAGLAVAISGKVLAGFVFFVLGAAGFAFGIWSQLQAERNGKAEQERSEAAAFRERRRNLTGGRRVAYYVVVAALTILGCMYLAWRWA